MRRLELLIKEARRESLNKEYSQVVGLTQEDFVAWANQAQDRLYSEAIKQHPLYFTGSVVIDAVAGQEAYDLPEDTYLSHIENVEYSVSGRVGDFSNLEQAKLKERVSYPSGNPGYYIRVGKQILMVPAPANGGGSKIRVTYVRKLPRLDIRRGVLETVTEVNDEIITMIATPASLAVLDPGLVFSEYNYLSVVNRDGELKVGGIEYDSVDYGTGVIDLTGGAFPAGPIIPAVGDFIVAGANTVNLPDLPETAERYLVACMIYRATFRDGSVRSKEMKALCDEILADTTQSFADIDHDVSHVTLLNTDYLDSQRLDII